ncbi:DNA translocase FtsK, partial [Bacillus norwichensis]
ISEPENQLLSKESEKTLESVYTEEPTASTNLALTEEIVDLENSLSSEESEETDAPVLIEDPTELVNSASTGEIVKPETQFSSEIKEASSDPVFIKESDEATESANPFFVEEIHEMEDQLSSEELEIEGMASKQSELNVERELIDDLPLDGENEKLEETVLAESESESSSPEAYEEMAVTVEMILDQEDEAEESSSEESSNVVESAKEGSDSKPRSNLPFNVLMLTQDKTKWKKQSEREKNSIEAVSAPVKEVEESETSISETVHYTFPDLSLLKPPVFKEENTEWLNEQTSLLDETMENFNVKARVVNASQGPSVTRFEVQPDKGVKVNKITNLSNDIKLSMAARDIRMEAPIPGTRSIGIELPNKESRPVQISEIIGKPAFSNAESPLTAALGLDISGEPVVTDLRKMPHGLIAGATGSGKSVCINSILVSLLYKARPDELKLMLIDPKMVELAPYNHIPHLVSPVITDVKAATAALKWAVDEMERRYELFVHAGVRDIGRFNELAKREGQKGEHLPYIVIIIDELADLMMVAPAEVEESICRIAQKARACGIHLLIATQRPSVDVITGLIKANVPTRIAFAVSSQVDSRTVIDVSGAEKLLGRGDMLFLNNGSVKPVRLQGTFVSDEEIDQVIDHVRDQGKPNYIFQQEELLKKAEIQENEDELLLDACQFVVKQGNASTSLLQRQFRIGYNRAARLMEMMEDQGVISGSKGSKPRDVLIKEAELDLLKDSLVH